MKIIVNGENREYMESLTIQRLLDTLEIQKERVAVELNANIVPRAKLHNTILKDDDKLEIVTFVGGG